MGKKIRFVNIETDDILGKKVEIEVNDTFHDVKKKLLETFEKKEKDTLGKVFLKQQIEIRDLDSAQYKDKKFLSFGAFDTEEPIEVHFKRVPILFFLFTNMKKTRRHVLLVDPSQNIRAIEDKTKEKFGLKKDLEIQFVHQGFLMPDTKNVKDFKSFDPAHSIVIVPCIFAEREEFVELD
ncbi:MAG: hypothetical protein ACFFCS_18325 [Candidatus Hodarchaeota archaeon]